MKRTIITLLALAGVAGAASETIVIGLTGTENPWEFGTYVTHDDAIPESATTNYTVFDNVSLGESGITCKMVHSNGRTSASDLTDNWTNQAALDFYNQATGNSLTSTQITDGTMSHSKMGGAYETLTLNFSNSADYQAGQSISIFAFVGSSNVDSQGGTLTSITITGLEEGYRTTIASATGTGFASTYSEAGEVSIIHIEGQLTSDRLVTLKPTGGKPGFAAVTVMPIPEPATATLSLLALAGLAARRRRTTR